MRKLISVTCIVCMMMLITGCGSTEQKESAEDILSAAISKFGKLESYTETNVGKGHSMVLEGEDLKLKKSEIKTKTKLTAVKKDKQLYTASEGGDRVGSGFRSLYVMDKTTYRNLYFRASPNENKMYYSSYSKYENTSNTINGVETFIIHFQDKVYAPFFEYSLKKEGNMRKVIISCKDLDGYQKKLVEEEKKENPSYDPLKNGKHKYSKNEYKVLTTTFTINEDGNIVGVITERVVDYGDNRSDDVTNTFTFSDFNKAKLDTEKIDKLMAKGAAGKFKLNEMVSWE